VVVGYTTGVFDLFHVGHGRILKNAQAMCDRPIVGIANNEPVSYKTKNAVTPIVAPCSYVDLAVEQSSIDETDAYNRYKFNTMFVNDDWYVSGKWKQIDQEMNDVGVRVVYSPYTCTNSSTLIINTTFMTLQEEEHA
jgi:cytidyltransferase-like protein